MHNTTKVEMYYKDACPFCIRAKSLLESKKIVVQEYPAATNPELFAEMQERSGSGVRSFPQIFINDRHIGGCDDLYALEEAGKLDSLLS